MVHEQRADLLGAPLSNEGIDRAIASKIEALQTLRRNLSGVGAHNSLFLLKNCFLLPKLLYTLRTVPTWKRTEALEEFDSIQKEILQDILNITLEVNAWDQASLPVRSGGLGIRKAADLAIPAYFSSLNSSALVAANILPADLTLRTAMPVEAEANWLMRSGRSHQPEEADSQKAWDKPLIDQTYQNLLDGSDSVCTQARLVAVTGQCSGAWLEAIPVAALGTQLDDEAVRISVSLRLGSNICIPHTCRCSGNVDADGQHGLHCQKSAGRHPRHSELNTIIHRSLSSIGRPSILEPVGMTREDGRRPDGLTLFPWHQGKTLVWDATCVSTLAPSNLQHSILQAGAAANHAEEKKREKYSDLASSYIFTPLGFETIGQWGPSTLKFIKELGTLLEQATGEKRSTAFLKQRLSVAIQRGNAAAVRGTVPEGGTFSELFHLPFVN